MSVRQLRQMEKIITFHPYNPDAMRSYFLGAFIFISLASLNVSSRIYGQTKSPINKLVFYGNTIEFTKEQVTRHYYLSDYRIPLERDFYRDRLVSRQLPIKLNNEKIYTGDDLFRPFHKDGGYSFISYILSLALRYKSNKFN